MICSTVHIIGFPSLYGGAGAELYHQIPVWEKLGVKLHFIPTQNSVCNEDFLAALPEIRQRTRRTVFVNCMTWLFGKEKEAMSQGDIALFLYQNDNVRRKLMPRLRAIKFITFSPCFDSSAFPFIAPRPQRSQNRQSPRLGRNLHRSENPHPAGLLPPLPHHPPAHRHH